jgi:hypothetical protein
MALETRNEKYMFFGIIAAIALLFFGAVAVPWLQRNRGRSESRFSEKVIGDLVHPVLIHKPNGVALVDTGEKDRNGRAVKVACATCHDTRSPNFQANQGELLKDFHQGLNYQHGSQTCLSCHHSGDYNQLKLADGRSLDFSESMQLCSQCHGPLGSQAGSSRAQSLHGLS